ncbi:cell cycle control protein [Mycena amicta]|nr:cell cycle control protein [Mycena amicta]
MGLFNRKSSGDDENKKEKGGWRRPANTAFKQQRLKAWQPILTPKTVLPTLFIVGILFAPIGGLLIWGSSLVSEMTFDYTDCENLTPASSNETLALTEMSSSQFNYKLRSADSKLPVAAPKFGLLDNSNSTDPTAKKQCVIEFNVPADIEPSIFIYYKLTNFFQNHRRYVKSLNTDQLKGKPVSNSTLDNGDCKPLASLNGKAIYPCGLIANSYFNGALSTSVCVSILISPQTPFLIPILLNPGSNDPPSYTFSPNGIAWPGEAKKYIKDPVQAGGYSSYDDIVPPPNWELRYGTTYNSTNIPDLHSDERFQNWMRTAGLPTFTKLYGRNDNDKMISGTYRIVIGLNFPVKPYKGTKSINAFLGWAYVAAASLFVLLAIAGTARHLIKPRRLGDMSLLSWNR